MPTTYRSPPSSVSVGSVDAALLRQLTHLLRSSASASSVGRGRFGVARPDVAHPPAGRAIVGALRLLQARDDVPDRLHVRARHETDRRDDHVSLRGGRAAHVRCLALRPGDHVRGEHRAQRSVSCSSSGPGSASRSSISARPRSTIPTSGSIEASHRSIIAATRSRPVAPGPWACATASTRSASGLSRPGEVGVHRCLRGGGTTRASSPTPRAPAGLLRGLTPMRQRHGATARGSPDGQGILEDHRLTAARWVDAVTT